MLSEPKKYQQALAFAPTLLGLSHTLMSYISALGAYRTESQKLNHNIDFAAIFFKQAKQVASLLERMATKKTCSVKDILSIDNQLQQFEYEYQEQIDERSAILLQQLRLIVQLLPQLWNFVEREETYHRSK